MDSTLQAVRRDTIGKNEAVRLRQAGKIPAVLYGGDSKVGESVTVDPKELSRILHSHSGVNSLIALQIDGTADTKVLVKQYQIDPVTHRLLHADFYRVAMDKRLRVIVPVQLTGEAKGVKVQGGTLDFKTGNGWTDFNGNSANTDSLTIKGSGSVGHKPGNGEEVGAKRHGPAIPSSSESRLRKPASRRVMVSTSSRKASWPQVLSMSR